MDLKNKNFSKVYHCPNCNNMYITIDNKTFECPICELLKFKNVQKSKKEKSSHTRKKCNYVHNQYEI